MATAEDPDNADVELVTMYRGRVSVPLGLWRAVLASAEQEIGILEPSESWLGLDDQMPELLTAKARSGVRVRLLLADPDGDVPQTPEQDEARVQSLADRSRLVVALYHGFLSVAGLEVRLNVTPPFAAMYFADDEALITRHVVGAPADLAPVEHLRQEPGAPSPRLDACRESFERSWHLARRLPEAFPDG